MLKLEAELRKALALVNASDSAGRAKVYESAQRAINAMPEATRAAFKDELLKAATRIEQDYLDEANTYEVEAVPAVGVHSVQIGEPATADLEFAEFEAPAKGSTKIRKNPFQGLSKLSKFDFPVRSRIFIVLAIVSVLIIVGLIATLLFSGSSNETSNTSSKANLTETSSEISSLTRLDFAKDLKMLTIKGPGSGSLETGFGGGVLISADTSFFGPQLVELDQSKIYFGKIEFRIKGEKADGDLPILFAGIQNFDTFGVALSGQDEFSYFVHTGRLGRAELSKTESGNYSVSGIILKNGETRDDRFASNAAGFKPFAAIAMEGSGVKVELVSLEIFDIEEK